MDGAVIDWTGPARQCCPECGRGPSDRTLGVTVEPGGRGVAHCFRCEHVETLRGERVDRRPAALPAPAAAPMRHEVLSHEGRARWAACGLIGGVGLAYLLARSCVIPPADGDLRFHPALLHWPSGYVGPTLVALVSDALTREPLTLHFTWVRPDGTKAPVDPPRLLLPRHRKAGGVVRLWPDEAVTLGLGVAEGVETALSLAHAYRPAWACIDAGNLAALPVLPCVESLLIAADHDPAGIKAAESCAQRWADAGRNVGLVVPNMPKTDLNDLARAA